LTNLTMDATRARLGFEPDRVREHAEWAAAAALVVVAVLIGSIVVRELRFAPWDLRATPVPAVATVVPAEAVSVPMLVLAAGREVRVGELRASALDSLGSMRLVTRAEESAPLGTREIRAYQGVTLVFEPFERAGDSRVAAIYLQ
jgi:hypothetical protein